MDIRIYLNASLEFDDVPTNSPYKLIVENKPYFGNDHISFKPRDNHGRMLIFHGWLLEEFCINRQWYESYVTKLCVKRENSESIDLYKAYRMWAGADNHWWNSHYPTLKMYTAMFKHCIHFLSLIPEDIKSTDGILQFVRLFTSNTKKEIVNFYKYFIESKNNMSEEEYHYIEKLFLNKLSDILLD